MYIYEGDKGGTDIVYCIIISHNKSEISPSLVIKI